MGFAWVMAQNGAGWKAALPVGRLWIRRAGLQEYASERHRAER